MNEVYPGIFLIQEKGTFGVIKPPENIYVLAGPDGIIYDAGYGTRRTVKKLIKGLKEIEWYFKEQNKEFNITRILVSHCHPDHFSGLKRIRKALGIKIVLTTKSYEIIKNKESFQKTFETDAYEHYLRIRKKTNHNIINFLRNIGSRFFYQKIFGVSYIDDPEEVIEDETDIIINGEIWKIFPSPGHAIDHISLFNEKKGILFSGDNILRSITTWLGPPNSNIEEYVKTIKKIKKLPNLQLILTAHGSPIENPNNRIEEILSHRINREKQVIELINHNSEKGISPKEIIRAIYPKNSRFLHQVARGWVLLTLKILESKNLIIRVEKKNKVLFFPFK